MHTQVAHTLLVPQDGHKVHVRCVSEHMMRQVQDVHLLRLTSVPCAPQLVNALITEKRSKAREAAMSQPLGLHSQLHVHDLQPVPANVRELLRGTGAAGGSGGTRVSKPGSLRTGGGLLAPKK